MCAKQKDSNFFSKEGVNRPLSEKEPAKQSLDKDLIYQLTKTVSQHTTEDVVKPLSLRERAKELLGENLIQQLTETVAQYIDEDGQVQYKEKVLRVQVIALIAIIFLATAFRLAYFNDLGYNSDEAVYAGQGAALAEAPVFKEIFPVFRAHPLLYQFVLAMVFKFGVYDWLGRVVSIIIGVLTVLIVYVIGRRLYGVNAGLFAALFMALMPYHVIPTRQVLLDGPMVFCSTLTLYIMVRFSGTMRPLWLYAAGAGMGLTVLAKETGILMTGAIYAFLALTPKVRVRVIDIVISLACMFTIIAAYPLSVSLAGGGGGEKTQNYLVWQLFRRPNHTWDFYFQVVPPAIGVLVIIAALLGFFLLRKQNSRYELLLFWWIFVPFAFFELWPTKGFQYLLPMAPAFALLAARTLALWPKELLPEEKTIKISNWQMPQFVLVSIFLTMIIAFTLANSTWQVVKPSQSASFLAGSGGLPGGREVGDWIKNNVPKGSTFMTIGPSMANVIKFYGHREAFGLSVSPNPLRRNPSYEPIRNPDFQIRTSEIQYAVWDSFSAERTVFFSEKLGGVPPEEIQGGSKEEIQEEIQNHVTEELLGYVGKYNGRVVHVETVKVETPEGNFVEKPVIIIYEVHP